MYGRCPMNQQFGVGAVLGTGFRVWAKNLIPFTLITAVIYLPVILWSVMFFNTDHTLKEVAYFGIGILVLTVVLNAFASATITYGVVMELSGKRASIGACIATGFKRLFPVLGVAILTGLAIVGGMILLIVPGIIIACMLYISTPASVIEKPGITGALGRSRELTRGHKGEVFGILFILWLIGWGVQKVQGAVMNPHDLHSIQVNAYVSLIVQVLLGSLGAVMCAVTYFYLRSEKDGTSADDLARVFE
jgi:hypothetical protein